MPPMAPIFMTPASRVVTSITTGGGKIAPTGMHNPQSGDWDENCIGDCNGNRHGNSNSYWDCDGNSYGYCYWDCYGNGDCHCGGCKTMFVIWLHGTGSCSGRCGCRGCSSSRCRFRRSSWFCCGSSYRSCRSNSNRHRVTPCPSAATNKKAVSAEREGFEPFEQRWQNPKAVRDFAHQRPEITLEMIRIALSVSARESTLVEWSRADFGQRMGSAYTLAPLARSAAPLLSGLKFGLGAQRVRLAYALAAADRPFYGHRRPEQATLYQVIRVNLETFYAAIEEVLASPRPAFVGSELKQYLDCGLLCRGFAWLKCVQCQGQRLVIFSVNTESFVFRVWACLFWGHDGTWKWPAVSETH